MISSYSETSPSILGLKFFLNGLFWKKTIEYFLGNWQLVLSLLEVNITLSINKTNKTGMDINDDIYRCPALEFELCVSTPEERHSQILSHMFMCWLVCVCVRARAR